MTHTLRMTRTCFGAGGSVEVPEKAVAYTTTGSTESTGSTEVRDRVMSGDRETVNVETDHDV
jgi:hypothetical protein